MRVKKSHDEALTLFETAPTRDAAKDKLATLRAVLKSPTADFVAADALEEFEPALALVAVATAWENAKDALPELAKALTVSEAPPAGKVFAAEYVKLAREADVPIANLRDFRDKTNSWSAVNSAYQDALAEYVQNKLRVASPNWAEIRAICKTDAANGWTALAAADAIVASGSTTGIDLPTKLDAAGEKFAQYLRFCADGNLDGLVRLYKDDKPTPILDVDFRKKTAAGILLKRTPLLNAHPKWAGDPVQYFFTNPYDGSEQLDKMASQFNTAVKLGGKLNDTQQLHVALVNAAAKSAEGKLAKLVPIDEKSLTDDQLAAALAYSKIVADDAKRSDKDRLAAAARAARLAFRQIDLSFADCKNDAQTSDREKAITEKIAGELIRPTADLIAKHPGRDTNALKFAALRADIFLKNKSSDEAEKLAFKSGRLGKLTACAEEVAGTPDEATALALVATYRFIDTYRGLTDEKEKLEVWNQIKLDAQKSLKLDPSCTYASIIHGYIDSSEYKADSVPGVTPPKGLRLTFPKETDEAIVRFEMAHRNLKTRKVHTIYSMQSIFLSSLAEQFSNSEKVGDKDRAPTLREQAKIANDRAVEQTPPK